MGMAATLTVLAVLLAVLLAAGFWVGLALLVTGLAGLVLVGADNAGGLVASTIFSSPRTPVHWPTRCPSSGCGTPVARAWPRALCHCTPSARSSTS